LKGNCRKNKYQPRQPEKAEDSGIHKPGNIFNQIILPAKKRFKFTLKEVICPLDFIV
jgi:hypothetical protein